LIRSLRWFASHRRERGKLVVYTRELCAKVCLPFACDGKIRVNLEKSSHYVLISCSTLAHVTSINRTFKVLRDRNFAAKIQDAVGLYLNPPDKALVLCVDGATETESSRAFSN